MLETNPLSTSNFFRYFIFHPEDKHLAKYDRCMALAMSIILGVLTAGFVHLIARIALYDRKFTCLPQSAITQVAQEKLGNKNSADLMTIGSLKGLSEAELTKLSLCFKNLPFSKKSNDKSFTAANIDQLEIADLKSLSVEKMEEVLPLLPREALLFINNVSHLPIDLLKKHYMDLFKTKDQSAMDRLKSLSAQQASLLLNELEIEQFVLLTNDIVNDLDVTLLKANFDKFFPTFNIIDGPSPSYEKLSFEMIEKMLEMFDKERLLGFDLATLGKLDASKLSYEQYGNLKFTLGW